MVAAGAALYLGTMFWLDIDATSDALSQLGISALVIGMYVTVLSYLVRFARWQLFLVLLNHRVPWHNSLRVYISGLALTASPAKLGETIRSMLLLPNGVPVSHSLASFIADRLADVIGVALLGALAGWLSGSRLNILEFLFILTFVGSLGVARMLTHPKIVANFTCIPLKSRAKRWISTLAAPAHAWAHIWSVPKMPWYIVAAMVAYGLQALLFAAFVHHFPAAPGVLHCVAIFLSSTLLGAASGIPGGLGAMEAALMFQLVNGGLEPTNAAAVTIGIRASTLWFGILLGVLALLGSPHTSAVKSSEN